MVVGVVGGVRKATITDKLAIDLNIMVSKS